MVDCSGAERAWWKELAEENLSAHGSQEAENKGKTSRKVRTGQFPGSRLTTPWKHRCVLTHLLGFSQASQVDNHGEPSGVIITIPLSPCRACIYQMKLEITLSCSG